MVKHKLRTVQHGGETRQQLMDRLDLMYKHTQELRAIIADSLWSGPKLIGSVEGEYHGFRTQVWYSKAGSQVGARDGMGYFIISEHDDCFRCLSSHIVKAGDIAEAAGFYGETLAGEHYHRLAALLRSDAMANAVA